MKSYNVCILGKKGYVGQELTTLVHQHPLLTLLNIESIADCVKHSSELDLVFLATPPAVSMEAASTLINTDLKIIDLSGAFRLPENDFSCWYGMQHQASSLIEKACYGLTPWAAQADAQLIANPGCYATAALMALLPLFKAKIIDTHSIIIDAKSGVSGSGKKPDPELMFCEIANNFYPYKIGNHQHVPEIEKAIYDYSNQKTSITLTTSILPIIRGIAMSLYVQAKSSFSSDEEISEALLNAFHEAYKSYPLVHFQEVGKGCAAEDKKILAINEVAYTPWCHIGFYVKKGQITLFSSLDNLLKGAASQAIENLNALFQLPLQTGLALKEGS